MDELTEKINEAVKEKLFIDTSKCENTANAIIDRDSEEYGEKIKEHLKDLKQKLIDIDRWYNEQMRKNKPAIIIDSKGRYVSSCGTASFLNYLEAVKNKQVDIHDKKYKKSILKLIKNNDNKY